MLILRRTILVLGAFVTVGAPIASYSQKALIPVNVAYITAVDQLAVAVAVSEGFFEKNGLDVKLARPFPSGVDVLNAMQAKTIDFGQVGAPLMGARLAGMNAVAVGTYGGSAVRLHADESYAMVARKDSGIDANNLKTLKGKKLGATIGSTNHLYALRIVQAAGLGLEEVEFINTPPSEMGVALQTRGVDAIAVWEPWPTAAMRDVPGSYLIKRGGGYTPGVNFIVAMADFAKANPDVVERYLLSMAEAAKWVRNHPEEAAKIVSQWYPNLKGDVLTESVKQIVKIQDGRLSQCVYVDTQEMLEFVLTSRKATPPAGFNILTAFDPSYMIKIQRTRPDLFEGLRPIPAGAQLPSSGSLTNVDTPAIKKACAT